MSWRKSLGPFALGAVLGFVTWEVPALIVRVKQIEERLDVLSESHAALSRMMERFHPGGLDTRVDWEAFDRDMRTTPGGTDQ